MVSTSGSVSSDRLREAREYLGFHLEDVAQATGWPQARIAALEDGTSTRITGAELRKLSRLYRRPVTWLQGETTFTPDAGFLQKLEDLTDGDREAVLSFAEWLQGAGPPGPPDTRR